MEENKVSRRSILKIGWVAFLVSTVGIFWTNIRSLMPNVLYEPPAKIKLGLPEDYALESATFVPDKKLFLVRREEGFACVSAICSHLGCTINSFDPADAEFTEPHSHCPCHGSVFALSDGRVLRSPAPSPLDFFQVSLSPAGRIVVDTSRKVGPEQTFKV